MRVEASALPAMVAPFRGGGVRRGGGAAPVTPPVDGHLRVAQFNVLNFFDTVNDPDIDDDRNTPNTRAYQVKLAKLSLAIREQLGIPDVLNLNEVENQRVLDDLLALPEMRGLGYRSVLGTRNDRRGIRNAMLYRDSRLELKQVEAFNPDIKLPDPAGGQFDPGKLYARAPLVVDFAVRGAAQAADGAALLTVIGNHFKSKLGGTRPEPRRQAQGELLGGFVDARRAVNPTTGIVVLGDLNALYQDRAYTKLANRKDGSQRLYDAPMRLPAGDRYTYRYRGTPNMLDHLLVTDDLKSALVSTKIPHFNSYKDAKQKAGDAKIADGVSDHDPIIADFDLGKLLRRRAA